MSEYRTARVLVRGELAGLLSETDAGYSFVYASRNLKSENHCK